jgi:SAM-dependent methyltransferase
LLEFTGERVIPGKVNPDLWNEHRSRYFFAARLCRGKRVLDLGCGAGYGAAELAAHAAHVVAVDSSRDAIAYGRTNFLRPNLSFVLASASQPPFPPASFDVVVAFELIEHLQDWERVLAQVRFLLRDTGHFIVSTPNKLYYAESRRLSGPNPFHVREFEFAEFRDALSAIFPQVSIYFQNHSAGITFQSERPFSNVDLLLERGSPTADEANFFVALCSPSPVSPLPALVHIPSAANILRERGEHIQLLQNEIRTKDEWLENLKQKHERLVEAFRQLEEELEQSNRWAATLNDDLVEARAEIERLNAELAERIAGYEAKIAALESEKDIQTQWALQTQRNLDQCVEILHETEKTVEERTLWAQRLDAQVRDLEARLSLAQASRWFRLGRSLGLGPDLLQK